MATTINTYYVDVDAEVGGTGTTNALTGANCAFKSLSIWESARDADLTAGDGASNYVVERAICGSAHANHTADTTAVTIGGWTTSANSYIDIRTDASNRAGLSWSASKYRLEVANATAVTHYEDYVRYDGLQVGKSSSSANLQALFSISSQTASANDIHISGCLLKQAGHATYTEPAVYALDADMVLSVWNTIAYGSGPATGANNAVLYLSTNTANIYSCVLVGGSMGLRGGGVVTAKNVYCGNTSVEDFYRASGTLTKVNCASEDQSADDTSGADETATNCVAAAVAYDTDTFVNVTAGSEDFHLAADGLSPLKGAGVDTSGEGAPLNFTTDIEGNTRDATWDIGADAWVEAGLSPAVYRRRLPWATHLRM